MGQIQEAGVCAVCLVEYELIWMNLVPSAPFICMFWPGHCDRSIIYARPNT